MTGAITWDLLGWLLGLFIIVLGGAFAIWWRIEGRIEQSKADTHSKATAASAHAALVASQLSDYKVHAAETFATKQGLRESTDQIMTAIGSVKNAVDGTNQRIDKLFDQPGPRRPRGQG